MQRNGLKQEKQKTRRKCHLFEALRVRDKVREKSCFSGLQDSDSLGWDMDNVKIEWARWI
jgi:hypothetical protein